MRNNDRPYERWQKQIGTDTPLTPFGEAVAAGDGTLHGAITYWQDRALKAEADASEMAAGQCIVRNGGLMADDHGNSFCDMQRQRDGWKQRAELAEQRLRECNDHATSLAIQLLGLMQQIEDFAVAHGEADFETGNAKTCEEEYRAWREKL